MRAVVSGPAGAPLNVFVTVTVQRTVPPPPFPEPLHCTLTTGSAEVTVVVV